VLSPYLERKITKEKAFYYFLIDNGLILFCRILGLKEYLEAGSGLCCAMP